MSNDINQKQFDTNRDGTVTEDEIQRVKDMLEIQLQNKKATTQKKMAWVALASMFFFTAVLFSPLVTVGRVQALADLLGLFYIAQASIVGAYMGVSAWMSKNG